MAGQAYAYEMHDIAVYWGSFFLWNAALGGTEGNSTELCYMLRS